MKKIRPEEQLILMADERNLPLVDMALVILCDFNMEDDDLMKYCCKFLNDKGVDCGQA